MRVRPLIWSAATLLVAIVMASADETSARKAKLGEFMAHYYQGPAPDLIPGFIATVQATGLAGEKNGRPPTIGFLSEIIAANPERVGGWEQKIPDGATALRSLWDEAVKLSHAGGVRSVTDHSPGNNDLNWGAFMATGNPDFVRRIIAELPTCDERKDRNLFFAGGTARWSLATNALFHPKVREALEAAKAGASPRLRELIDETLTRDPGELIAEITKVVQQQRAVGKWQ